MPVLKFLYTFFYWISVMARWLFVAVIAAMYLHYHLMYNGGEPKPTEAVAVSYPSLSHFFLALAGFVVGIFANLFIHEFAHGVVGVLLGLKIHRLVIGFPIPVRYVPLGFPFELSTAFPNLSCTRYGFLDKSFIHLRIAMMLMAGPAATGLMLLLCLGGIGFLDRPPYVEEGNRTDLYILAGLMASTAYIFLSCMIPASFKSDGKPFQSDMLQLFLLVFLNNEKMEQTIQETKNILEFDKIGMDVPTALTPAEAEQAARDYGNNPRILLVVAQLSSKSHPRLGLNIYRRILDLPQSDPYWEGKALLGYLAMALQCGACKEDPRVYMLSLKLTELMGASPTAFVIRGAVLIDLDRIQEGAGLIDQALINNNNPVDLITGYVFRTLAAQRLQEVGDAEAFKSKIRRVSNYKEYPMIQRLGFSMT